MEVCSTSEVTQMDSFLLVRIPSQPRTHIICNGSPAHLHGTDVGEPPRWTFLADPSSPYYIEEDTFYDINKTIATVTRIKSIHNCNSNHPLPLPPHAHFERVQYYSSLTRQFRSIKRAREWEICGLGPPGRKCHQASPLLFHSFQPADLHHPWVPSDALSCELCPHPVIITLMI